MVITERTDYTVVIQKEPCDAGIQSFLKASEEFGKNVKIFMGGGAGYLFTIPKAKEALFSDDFLILYFDKVPDEYQVGTKVGVKIGMMWFI